MTQRQFGLSTHLFHSQRLTQDHLALVAAHGFTAIELFATRSHFDYHDPQAIAALGSWLAQTGIELHSVHAPIGEAMEQGTLVRPYSLAAGDEQRRATALAEAEAALRIAQTIPFRYLVAHLGVPASQGLGAVDNHPSAARRSASTLAERTAEAGLVLALEVLPNALSDPSALVGLIENDLDEAAAGVCLDFGHAHMMGDVADAVETLSGHLVTTHVHDNRGTRDDHLVPFAGSIAWDPATMELQKIGYDGALVFEVAGGADPGDVLRRAAAARDRLDELLMTEL